MSDVPSPGDLLNGASTDSGGTLDLYGLGAFGNEPVYYTDQTGPMRNPGFSSRYPSNVPKQVNLKFTNYTSSTNYVQQFVSMSQSDNASFQAVQAALYAAGFYGTSKPRLGTYTSRDLNAMKAALKTYQQVGGATGATTTFNDFLNSYITKLMGGGGGGGGGGPVRAPLVISYTDPAELHEAIQSAAQSSIGRNLSKDELAAFVKSFHGKEASAQRAAYNGAKSVTNPEVTGESSEFVQAKNEKEIGERDQATYIDVMNQLLGVK